MQAESLPPQAGFSYDGVILSTLLSHPGLSMHHHEPSRTSYIQGQGSVLFFRPLENGEWEKQSLECPAGSSFVDLPGVFVEDGKVNAVLFSERLVVVQSIFGNHKELLFRSDSDLPDFVAAKVIEGSYRGSRADEEPEESLKLSHADLTGSNIHQRDKRAKGGQPSRPRSRDLLMSQAPNPSTAHLLSARAIIMNSEGRVYVFRLSSTLIAPLYILESGPSRLTRSLIPDSPNQLSLISSIEENSIRASMWFYRGKLGGVVESLPSGESWPIRPRSLTPYVPSWESVYLSKNTNLRGVEWLDIALIGSENKAIFCLGFYVMRVWLRDRGVAVTAARVRLMRLGPDGLESIAYSRLADFEGEVGEVEVSREVRGQVMVCVVRPKAAAKGYAAVFELPGLALVEGGEIAEPKGVGFAGSPFIFRENGIGSFGEGIDHPTPQPQDHASSEHLQSLHQASHSESRSKSKGFFESQGSPQPLDPRPPAQNLNDASNALLQPLNFSTPIESSHSIHNQSLHSREPSVSEASQVSQVSAGNAAARRPNANPRAPQLDPERAAELTELIERAFREWQQTGETSLISIRSSPHTNYFHQRSLNTSTSQPLSLSSYQPQVIAQEIQSLAVRITEARTRTLISGIEFPEDLTEVQSRSSKGHFSDTVSLSLSAKLRDLAALTEFASAAGVETRASSTLHHCTWVLRLAIGLRKLQAAFASRPLNTSTPLHRAIKALLMDLGLSGDSPDEIFAYPFSLPRLLIPAADCASSRDLIDPIASFLAESSSDLRGSPIGVVSRFARAALAQLPLSAAEANSRVAKLLRFGRGVADTDPIIFRALARAESPESACLEAAESEDYVTFLQFLREFQVDFSKLEEVKICDPAKFEAALRGFLVDGLGASPPLDFHQQRKTIEISAKLAEVGLCPDDSLKAISAARNGDFDLAAQASAPTGEFSKIFKRAAGVLLEEEDDPSSPQPLDASTLEISLFPFDSSEVYKTLFAPISLLSKKQRLSDLYRLKQAGFPSSSLEAYLSSLESTLCSGEESTISALMNSNSQQIIGEGVFEFKGIFEQLIEGIPLHGKGFLRLEFLDRAFKERTIIYV